MMTVRTSYAQGTPNWVDLQTTDQDAAKAFYSGLFGWTYDDQPMPEGQVYSMAMLGEHTVAALAPQPPEMAAAGAPTTRRPGPKRPAARSRWRRSTSWTPGGWRSSSTRPARRWRCGRPESTSA